MNLVFTYPIRCICFGILASARSPRQAVRRWQSARDFSPPLPQRLPLVLPGIEDAFNAVELRRREMGQRDLTWKNMS
jgi:hypothetical protein